MIKIRLLLFLFKLMHSSRCSSSQTLWLLAWLGRSHGLWPAPQPLSCTPHTFIYTHKLTHPSSFSKKSWVNQRENNSQLQGTSNREAPHFHPPPPHVIHRTLQMIINHAHCITIILSFIYETPRKSPSHTTTATASPNTQVWPAVSEVTISVCVCV